MKMLFVFCVFSIACFCEAKMTPSQILAESTRVSLTTSFSARMLIFGGGETSLFMYYQNVNPNGIVYSLMKPLDNKIKTSFLVNARGRFELIGNTAIRTDYVKAPQIISPAIPIRKDENTFIIDGKEITRKMVGDTNFSTIEKMSQDAAKTTVAKPDFKDISCRNTDYCGQQCYQIRFKYTTDDGMFTNEQIIDRNTFFTYQRKILNQRGEAISEITYTNVVISPVFEKGFFELPRDVKMVVTKTLHDSNKQSSIALDKVTPPPSGPKQPSIGTLLDSFLNRTVSWFWSSLSILSCIFAIIAIGILISIAVVKFKKTT